VNRVRLAIAIAGALIACAAIALATVNAVAHEGARAAYERESGLLMRGDRSYDAARSDVLYQDSIDRRAAAERFAILLAIALSFGIGALGLAAPDPKVSERASPRRAWIAIAIDAAIAIACLATALAVRRALDPAHAAFGAIGSFAITGASLGVMVALFARGSSFGMRFAKLRAHRESRAPGVARAIAALALSLSFAWLAPVALAVGMRPFPLAWTGLRLSRA
jgi:hypothetical protein